MNEYCDHMWSFKTTPSGLVKVCCLCGETAPSSIQPETDKNALTPAKKVD